MEFYLLKFQSYHFQIIEFPFKIRLEEFPFYCKFKHRKYPKFVVREKGDYPYLSSSSQILSWLYCQ